MSYGSYIAEQIDRDYRRKQVLNRKRSEKCKDRKCVDCKYNKICIEQEEKNV